MELGETITVEISSINSEGEGIARVGAENFVVFVPGALPEERVRCRVTRLSRNYAAAVALEILEASRDRVEPKCGLYDRCGGCQLQHASYGRQIEIKGEILSDALKRIGRVDYARRIECVPSPEEWGYRNKTTIPVHGAGRGGERIVCGYYERRTHNVVPFDGCAVLHPSISGIMSRTISAISDSGLRPYSESKRTGDIRYLAARAGASGGSRRVLTGVVSARTLGAREFGRLRSIHQRLGEEFPELAGAVLNVNSAHDNFIWGPVNRTIHGGRHLDLDLGGYKFRTDLSSFFQINAAQADSMFSCVRRIVESIGASSILELYSGVGSLTAYLSGAAGHVDAVEEWRPSARRLSENMARNGIGNVEVWAGAAENFMKDRGTPLDAGYDAVVLDPPRTGCDERVIDGVRKLRPRLVVYVSCNPATLARDICRLMMDGEYKILEITAFDMFPQTAHVETVCALEIS
jgi:23S rRNA (uracil1939-C5)-methyltransferase